MPLLRSRYLRIIVAIVAVIAAVMLYRISAVYRFRPGHCEAVEMAPLRRCE